MTLDNNDFLRESTLFNKNSVYFWPGDLIDAILTLNFAASPLFSQQKPFS